MTLGFIIAYQADPAVDRSSAEVELRLEVGDERLLAAAFLGRQSVNVRLDLLVDGKRSYSNMARNGLWCVRNTARQVPPRIGYSCNVTLPFSSGAFRIQQTSREHKMHDTTALN